MSGASADRPRGRGVIGAVLFLGTFLLFARAIGHDFVNYDDPDYVTANVHVRAGLTWAGVKWAFGAADVSYWHPLTWLSHMLDWQLFGDHPAGHHAMSVLWHALTATMAFLALRRLTGSMGTSAACAALFAWHPLRVESVAWIAERKDVLGGFFWMVALWCYVGYAEKRRTGQRAVADYALAGAAFAGGLMSKPMLVTLPCVLLLLDFWPLRRLGPTAAPGSPGWRKLVLEKGPFFALSVAVSVVTVIAQKNVGTLSTVLPLEARLGNAVIAVVRYLGNFFLPVDLAVLYPHPGVWPARQVGAALVVVAAVTAVAAAQWRRRPWIIVGWCWFLGTLLPVAGLVQVGIQAMADRYTYLTMLGVQIALLWTGRDLITTTAARRAWAVAGGVVLLGYAIGTWRQLGVWQNSFTLFDRAIAVTKDNYLAYDNRGLFLYQAGRVDEAMADYRRALAINPAYMNANNNLGHALAEHGRPADALPLYRTALQAQPGNLEVHNNLANALSDVNQLDEAMEHYDFVLTRQPDHANALNGSAVVLAMKHRLPEAKTRLEQALRLAPANASAHNNLGNVYSMLGDREAAIGHYRRATELSPNEAHPFFLIGSLLNQQEKFAAAVPSLQRAVALQPVQPDALAQLGLALARLGRREEAMRALQTALQQRPGDATIKAWLEAVQGDLAK